MSEKIAITSPLVLDLAIKCPAHSPSLIPDSKVCCFAVYVCPDSRPLTIVQSHFTEDVCVLCSTWSCTLNLCVVCRECHFLVVSMLHMWFMCTPGVPLTPSNVMGAVEKVRRWWSERGEGGVRGLAYWLCIPQSKEDEIKHNFSDVMEQKKQMISYWINTDPLAGWRTLITALDGMKETQLGDLIRSNAEPLTGSQVRNVHKCAW